MRTSSRASCNRALASHRLMRLGNGGAVSLSWRRAEEVVNDLREHAGADPLTLPQTGGEGELSERAARALGDLGWRVAPLDTSGHHAGHVSEPASPPPTGQGERDAPREPPDEWRRAHEEAEGPS